MENVFWIRITACFILEIHRHVTKERHLGKLFENYKTFSFLYTLLIPKQI